MEIADIKDHRAIAGLLKLFFVKLPEPLMTFELHDKFLRTNSTSIH